MPIVISVARRFANHDTNCALAPAYSPASPAYSPTSPSWSPSSPAHNTQNGAGRSHSYQASPSWD
ncbi:hypothetical protein F5146DRAFT_65273 [Armillaria mellea]|nr:hypothetical protein F5146DRAFT_65273 [Armillaria mellea]